MINRKTILTAFLFLVLIFFFEAIAVFFRLYWQIPQLDIPMHLLGGIFSAYVGFSFLNPSKSRVQVFTVALFSALAVGILWEVFEFKTGLTFTSSANYWPDTIKDVSMDILGSFLAAFYILKKKNAN